MSVRLKGFLMKLRAMEMNRLRVTRSPGSTTRNRQHDKKERDKKADKAEDVRRKEKRYTGQDSPS